MTAESHSHTPSELSIFSLNVRFGLADDGPNSWKHRRKLFPELLARWPADFYAFQEVNAFQAEVIDAILKGYSRIGQRSPSPSFWQNNVIYAHPRWQCLRAEHFYLSPTPDIPSRYRNSRWPRQCTMGLYQSDRHQLVCANTHFDFAPDVQTQSAELIMQRLASFPSRPATLLAGDFNASSNAPCRKVFIRQPADEKSNDTAQTPFQDAFASNQSGTHHGFSDKSEGEPIDWILFTRPLELTRSLIIDETVNGRYPSDHFPLWAIFKWEED